MKTSPYIAHPPFFKFYPTPPPALLLPLSLTGWVIISHLICYLLLTDIWIYACQALVSLVQQGLCYVFYATRRQFTEV